MPKTRKSTEHYLLGQPAPLPVNKLPSNQEVINFVRLLAQQQGLATHRAPPSSIYHAVADDVRKIWSDEGIPIYDKTKVLRKLRCEYDVAKKTSKIVKTARQSQKALTSRFGELFDIAICKCKTLGSCNCPRDAKVPSEEWNFLRDQRGPRELTLGGVDQATSSQRAASLQRRTARLHQQCATMR